ncbi:hypothetical protein QCA50_006899 [Cerrena zonata]|uniref:Solute carrier family 40 member n=1 Tax=Cerrena zonata TaxID=2478898 RepID=A0AAW0GG85_9APHY
MPLSQSVAHRYLYLSHFLSTWNSRAFEFGAVLFISSAFPGSLLPTSVYALARALSAILFAPFVGKYIDTHDRLHVVRLSILSQRLAVAVSCVIIYLLLVEQTWSATVRWSCLAAISLLACAEKLSSVMNLVSVERDWVVVVSNGNDDILSGLNAQMRRIDLVCKLVGPLAIALVAGYSTTIALFATLGINITSPFIEYYTIAKVYFGIPDLQRSRALADEQPEESGPSEQDALLPPQDELSSPAPQTYWKNIQAYVRSPVFLPSLATSFLYFTVLNFSGQMVTYLLTLPPISGTLFSYNSATIGLLRTLSVVFEVGATFLCPILISRVGPIRAGLWAINEQLLSLVIGTSLFLYYLKNGSSSIAALPLVFAVIPSRMGLWSFDLSVQLQIQQIVPRSQMGSFSAMETALQNTFELLSYASTIVWSRPDQFQYPVVMSCCAVACAAILYARYVRQRRGHLLHLGPCMDIKMDEICNSDEQSEDRSRSPSLSGHYP